MRSRFQFIDDHRDTFEVKRPCLALDVNRSGYYMSGGPRDQGRPAAGRSAAGR
ncbi:hypothetical protein ACGFYA_04315 [Streptomyces sp. NPDC048305]|uniref:hypothetical protein n=1 Tax=Streptomyces sp. NPDC048305 TaxID=3365532 RepID=UPI003711E3BE